MPKREHIVAAGALVATLAALVVFTQRRGERETLPAPAPIVEATSEARSPSIAAPAVAVEPSPSAPAATAIAPDVDHVQALRKALASEDAATRIAAVEAAVRATATETLRDLEQFDPKRDPDTAPTVIHAVALLGASAGGAERDRAARTLASWLREEMKREGVDALGNVSNLVEALGNVGGPDAVDALTTALDRGDLELHVQTLAIMKLGELADGRARGAVERFAQRVATLPASEGLEEELRVEAIAAAQTSLARL
jgi:HEAT repeat protein